MKVMAILKEVRFVPLVEQIPVFPGILLELCCGELDIYNYS